MNSVKGKDLKDVCEEMTWKGVRDGEGGDTGEKNRKGVYKGQKLIVNSMLRLWRG